MHQHVRRSLAATGTTALLAAALLSTPGAQAAAAVTCQGKDVTIDGSGQATVTGTLGDDVIAATLGSTVNALAGNDLICVLPGTATAQTIIDAGEGDDSVDTTAIPAEMVTSTVLGLGDDTFTGGPGIDHVLTDGGNNRVSTGAGNDSVDSGVKGQPNSDRLDLGTGEDLLDWHGIQAPQGSVVFGGSFNTIADADGGAVAIDAKSQRIDRDGETVLKWQGTVSTYVVDSTATTAAFTGTDLPETFYLRDPETSGTPTTVTVDMAGGDDTMTLRSNAIDGSTWDGGEGTDLFQVAYDYQRILLDLRTGQFETGAADVTADQKVSNVEDVDAITATIDIKGDDPDNVFNLLGCDINAVGRAGADTISYGVNLDNAPALTCSGAKMVARGGKDADTITGTASADRLFGNKGDDMIEGLAGDDVVFAGDDNDRVRGNAGNDTLRGGKGNDELAGNEGNDRVQGDQGNDRLLGHSGNDVLVGGLGFDTANGGTGTDRASSVERRFMIER